MYNSYFDISPLPAKNLFSVFNIFTFYFHLLENVDTLFLGFLPIASLYRVKQKKLVI